MQAQKLKGLREAFVGIDGKPDERRIPVQALLEGLLSAGKTDMAERLAAIYAEALDELGGSGTRHQTLRDSLIQAAENGALESTKKTLDFYSLVTRIIEETSDPEATDEVLLSDDELRLLRDGTEAILDRSPAVGGRARFNIMSRLNGTIPVELKPEQPAAEPPPRTLRPVPLTPASGGAEPGPSHGDSEGK